jgi:hypothetical protein
MTEKVSYLRCVALPADPFLQSLWLFIRGDSPPRDFEAWLCADRSAEERLGGDLYLAAISADYRSAETIERLRNTLRTFARATSPFAFDTAGLKDR